MDVNGFLEVCFGSEQIGRQKGRTSRRAKKHLEEKPNSGLYSGLKLRQATWLTRAFLSNLPAGSLN